MAPKFAALDSAAFGRPPVHHVVAYKERAHTYVRAEDRKFLRAWCGTIAPPVAGQGIDGEIFGLTTIRTLPTWTYLVQDLFSNYCVRRGLELVAQR
jgi:hypothetical protein